MPRVYIYVLKYDLGFAPNPFDGVCTFACCKPIIRRTAQVGDWLVGVGGQNLDASGRCIFAMKVTGAMTFDEYWASPDFRTKRPRRNGSRKSMVGDNVYWREYPGADWSQENSVHSKPDGKQDAANTRHDTSVNRILTSKHFVYFGRSAPAVPPAVMASLGYRNWRGHRVFELSSCEALLTWISEQAGEMNRVLDKPFQFEIGHRRYSKQADRMI